MAKMRILLYNIEYENGIRGRYEYLKLWRYFQSPKYQDEKIARFIANEDPDVVALLEVDLGSVRTRFKDKSLFYKKYFGFNGCAAAPKYPDKNWPRILRKMPFFRKQGNALLARNNPKAIRFHWLSEGAKRLLIEAELDNVTLFLAHLSLRRKTREKQMLEIGNIVSYAEKPVVLMGDFNTFRGEKELDDMLRASGLHKTYRVKYNSYPAVNPKKQFDYIFVSKGIKVNSFRTLNWQFSDHLPLMMDFTIG